MDEAFDLLISHGTVIDGTGAPRFDADVGVRGGRIVFVGDAADAGAAGAAARRHVDASGLIVAPGFIDCHTHDDRALLSAPDMTPKVSQGVTTVITGNCGVSLAPTAQGLRRPTPAPLDLLDLEGGWFRFATFESYLAQLRADPAATNTAPMVGHTTLRLVVMDRVDRPANPDETQRMRALVEEALAAGAVGCSSGLFYEPAMAATTEEVIEVFEPMSRHGGVYCAHMRNEGDDIFAAMEETLRIGRTLGVPSVISHHKVIGLANHGRSAQTLPYIAQHMKEQALCLDCYPYAASSTVLSEHRAALAAKVKITWSKPHPEHNGRDLAEVAAEMGLPRAEAIGRLLPAGGIYFSMLEADVQRILSFPDTMIGSDGIPHDAIPHPRLWGTFPRVLGHYSRDLKLFPLEAAVRKMTGLTARNFSLRDRGELRPGAFADITLFDAATVADAADFERSALPARGIASVFVNGEAVWLDGAPTGARPGRVLSRSRDAREPGQTAPRVSTNSE
jgi:N-acyl-D-amino-acid deacylase